MTHSSILSGSIAERRIQCPGSAVLENSDAAAPNISSPAAKEGTALHTLIAEKLLDEGGAAQTIPPAGDTAITVDGVTLSADVLTEKFWPAYKAIQAFEDKHDIQDAVIEQRYSHRILPGVYGTVDYAGRAAGDYPCIVDFKFGSGIRVSPVENYQLAFYAIGLYDHEPAWFRGPDQKVVFAIIQPWHDGTVTQEWETTLGWLLRYRELETRAYWRIKKKDQTLKVGPWCRFCRGRAICSVRQNTLLEFADSEPAKRPELLNEVDLAHFLEKGEEAVVTYEALRQYARQKAEEGMRIPGYKLIESIGNRQFKSGTEGYARTLLGDDAFDHTLKSPVRMERAFHEKGIPFAPLAALIERPSRGLRLVRDNHPSDAVDTATEIPLPTEIKPITKGQT